MRLYEYEIIVVSAAYPVDLVPGEPLNARKEEPRRLRGSDVRDRVGGLSADVQRNPLLEAPLSRPDTIRYLSLRGVPDNSRNMPFSHNAHFLKHYFLMHRPVFPSYNILSHVFSRSSSHPLSLYMIPFR